MNLREWGAAGRRLQARLQDPPVSPDPTVPRPQPRAPHPQMFLPAFRAAGLGPMQLGAIARSPVLAQLLVGLKSATPDEAEAILAALGVLAG